MNRKKFSNICSAFMIIGFFGFVFGLFALSAYENITDYSTYSYYENRNLTMLPEPDTDSVLDGSFFSKLENWYKDHVAKRNGVLSYDTFLNMNILRRPVVNGIVITDDILLPYNKPETVNKDEIDNLAQIMSNRLRGHADKAESCGAEFYYVAVPCQYVYYEDQYPWYLNSRAEYTKASSEALFGKLEEKNISYIDMNEEFKKLGHLPEFSSAVDNHYGIVGAYETYRTVMERINEDTDLNIDILEDGEYTLTELPNPYIGSRTRKLLGQWRYDERLSIITPNEEIPFTRWNYGNEQPSASTVYVMPENEESRIMYGMYMGDDCSITRIETERPELPTVLIYGDSFTNAFECIVWNSFDTMYSLDFRYYTEMPLDDFIEKVSPDVVICIRDYEALLNLEYNGC